MCNACRELSAAATRFRRDRFDTIRLALRAPGALSSVTEDVCVCMRVCICVKKAWEELRVVPLSSPPFLKEYSGFNTGLPWSTAFGGIMLNSTKNDLKSFVKKKKKKSRLRWGIYNGSEEITKCKAYNFIKTLLNIPKCLSFSPSLLQCWKLETSQKMKLNLHRWPPNPVSHPLLLSSLTRQNDLFFWCISSKGLFDCSCLLPLHASVLPLDKEN